MANAFWALIMYLALVPSLYVAYLINPESWVLPPSHFTEDNAECLSEPLVQAQSEDVVKVRDHSSSYNLNHWVIWTWVWLESM